MPDWKSQDIHDWVEQAMEEQQFLCDRLGDRYYDLYETDEIQYLDMKIGFAFYGPPKNVDKNQDEIKVDNYTDEQQKLIKIIQDKILDKTGRDKIHVAFIYTNIKQHEDHYQLPIIRILGSNGKDVYFVDHSGRVYTGWTDFFENNNFPKCIYCFPENGIYSTSELGKVKLTYATSPNCNLGERAAHIVDTTSTVDRVANFGRLAASKIAFLFPPAVPVFIAAAIATFTAIGSRAGGIGGCFGFVGGGIACKALKVSCLEGAPLSTNELGIRIVCKVHDMVLKAETCSIKNNVNLSTLMLFFAHTCVSLKCVRTIITEVQHKFLDDYKSNLRPEQREGFQKVVESTAGSKSMHENAKVIRCLKHIEHAESFFRNLISVLNEGAEHDIKLTDKGLISINEQLDIHPDKMMSIKSRQTRDKIFECTQKLESDLNYNVIQFHKDTKHICSQERIQFEHSRKTVISKMCVALGKDLKEFEINGNKIFENLQPFEIDRLGNVMENSGRKYDKELLQAVLKFSSHNECKNVSDFFAFFEFVYQEALNQKSHLTDLGRKQRFPAFITRLNDPKTNYMQDFITKFNCLKSVVAPHNASASPAFASVNLATYHFYKHKHFDGTELSSEQYFKEMDDLFQNKEIPQVRKLSQEGNKSFVTFTNSVNGAMGVTIEPVIMSDRGDVFAVTFMYDKKVHKNR